MASQGSILFVDAYDSFAENVAALLHECLQVQVTSIKIDCNIQQQYEQSIQAFFSCFDAIVFGPGPGNPDNDTDIGLFHQVWECAEKQKIPILGICLGFQSLCARYDISVVRMGLPCHGHAKEVHHTDSDIFRDAGSIIATCYNSLGVSLKDLRTDVSGTRPSSSDSSKTTSSYESLQSEPSSLPQFESDAYGFTNTREAEHLEILAWDQDEWVMAAKHKHLPFYGFQFHPESCKSNIACQKLIKRWWEDTTGYNDRHRSDIHRRQATSPDLQASHPTVLCNDTAALLAELQAFSNTCGGNVYRKSLHLPGASTMIADLCHKNSSADRVAMLESTKRGRYSIYAFPDKHNFLLEYEAGHVMWRKPSSAGDTHRRMLGRELATAVLATFIRSRSLMDKERDIPFRGGFIGFLSYEFGTASLNLKVSKLHEPKLSTPEMSLLWVDRSVVYDHDTGRAYVQSIRESDSIWVEEMATTLQSAYEGQAAASLSVHVKELEQILSSAQVVLPDHDNYISQIKACQSELLAGNSYELCLTTEATVTTPVKTGAPYLLYRNIQRHNPVPFAAYISLDKTTILSSSPEQFLSWSSSHGTIDMIPMKGTVKRTPDMTLTRATEILSSAKESAENLMIADLIRHDLYSTVGRDAKVEVVKLCDVVVSETVFSLVSHIRAHVPIALSMDNSSGEYAEEMAKYGIRALLHTLPPGSMTGAPKKRSCEILHNLEQRDRGVYSGAIGYMDVCGGGAWSVVIRSAFSNSDDNFTDEVTGEERQKWRIGAGGAITVLSDEEQEWEEMKTKLESVLKGFNLA